MELISKHKKPSLKTNNIDDEISSNKHIKFENQVVVEKHKEPIHLDESNHKFKEAETHYQDIVNTYLQRMIIMINTYMLYMKSRKSDLM
jgi:hypothetical protein